MDEIISLGGIVLASILLIVLSYKGYSILLSSILTAALVALTSGLSPVQVVLGPYMDGFATFAKDNYLIFLFSALFGKLMTDSGAASIIAHSLARLAKRSTKYSVFWGVISLPIITAVLTYGGVSMFVVVFALVAIAKDLFKELDIPWHLFNIYCIGSGTFTMHMLPGSPAIQNLIPMKYFGTTPMAAPVIGIICSLVTIILSLAYIKWSVEGCLRKGEGFYPSGEAIQEAYPASPAVNSAGRLWKALLPLTIPSLVMNGLGQNAVISLVCAVIVCFLLFREDFPNLKKTLNLGVMDSVIPTINVCATVGFGKAFSSASGFTLITESLGRIPGPPELQIVVAVGIICGITGSGAGGLGLTMEILGDRFLAMNIDRSVAHRIASMSSCFGGLPHNGSTISGFAISKLTHRQAYKHNFYITFLIPGIAVIVAVCLAQLGLR